MSSCVSSLNPRPLVIHTTKIHHNFALICPNIDTSEATLTLRRLIKLGEQVSYAATAKRYGYSHSTVSRPHPGFHGSYAGKFGNYQLMRGIRAGSTRHSEGMQDDECIVWQSCGEK
ncbi:uncharacterized protein BDR25DRAFT_21438 [Lindgomyces ingoldianus]|uniref:Uncharacterized protein n=1 Tax=Lindgomyces ingoldianus TaxID=673940 RepID=A0ACB6QYF1_9PLEO|nr:uncharacterized protein BDR25DRAFT_21438 [Lindgomyces ingoldianus]KAF2471593.1 hypothetical protein BDR25DRAFT_21438 [Lindgomyces ingoldianus]